MHVCIGIFLITNNILRDNHVIFSKKHYLQNQTIIISGKSAFLITFVAKQRLYWAIHQKYYYCLYGAYPYLLSLVLRLCIFVIPKSLLASIAWWQPAFYCLFLCWDWIFTVMPIERCCNPVPIPKRLFLTNFRSTSYCMY